MRPLLSALLLALFLVPAHADVVYLTNGRTLEGKVVSQRDGLVTLQVAGGSMALPETQVQRVVKRRTAQEDYALRSRRTDMNDPEAVEQLSEWASRRGLGEQARGLSTLARDLRLRARVAEARAQRSVQGFIDTYYWARDLQFSEEIQGWLLTQAAELDPQHPDVQYAQRQIAAAAAAREAAARAAAEAEAERQRLQAERRERRRRAREEALEAQLAERAREAEQLRARIQRLEQRREVGLWSLPTTILRRRNVRRAARRADCREPLRPIMRRPLLAPRCRDGQNARPAPRGAGIRLANTGPR